MGTPLLTPLPCKVSNAVLEAFGSSLAAAMTMSGLVDWGKVNVEVVGESSQPRYQRVSLRPNA